MRAQKATATGTLASTPLVNLLVYMLDRRLSGTLIIEDHRYRKSAILLEEGAPRKARTPEAVITLGDLLIERRVITQSVKEETLAAAKQSRQLHGQVLVGTGALGHDDLADALGEQLCRKIDWIAALPGESVYGYYDKQNFLGSYAGDGAAVDPLSVVWRVVRGHVDVAIAEGMLARFGQRPLRLHLNARVSRFGFDSNEQALLDVMRVKPLALGQLLETGLLPPEQAKRLLYVLAITRHLDLGRQDAQPIGVETSFVGAQSAPSLPPAHQTGPRPKLTPSAPQPGPSGFRSRMSESPPVTSSPPPVSSPSPSSIPARASSPGHPSPIPERASFPGQPSPIPERASFPGQPSSIPARASSPGPSSMAPSRPSSPSARPSAVRSAPPERKSPSPSGGSFAPAEVEALKKELRERAASVDDQTYYEILELDKDAPGAAVQAAFFKLAKKWHPDRLGPEFEDVRSEATRVFSRMTEAHQVLSNEEQRARYDQMVKEGGATAAEQEQVQRVLRAATAFQKAEVLMRKGNVAEAEKEAAKAHEDDPDQAEYAALYADILSRSPDRAQNGNYDDLVKLVNDARKTQPDNLKVRLYRARVLKRAGDHQAAMKEFRHVVRAQPHNVEAARELRLYNMRQGKEKESTLKKLFRR